MLPSKVRTKVPSFEFVPIYLRTKVPSYELTKVEYVCSLCIRVPKVQNSNMVDK